MARACTTCTHEKRAQIDRSVLAGVPIASIARDFKIPDTSLRTHAANHLSTGLMQAIRTGQPSTETTLVAHLARVLEDVEVVRSGAILAGQASVALRASQVTKDVIATFADFAGVSDTTVAAYFSDSDALARSVARVIAKQPDVGFQIASELRGYGAEQLAANISEFSTRQDPSHDK